MASTVCVTYQRISDTCSCDFVIPPWVFNIMVKLSLKMCTWGKVFKKINARRNRDPPGVPEGPQASPRVPKGPLRVMVKLSLKMRTWGKVKQKSVLEEIEIPQGSLRVPKGPQGSPRVPKGPQGSPKGPQRIP